ncbi:MAG: response regulator [Cyclobacteriaceae bacterium]|nr:response regulator [Cyclobacteriaceae bacterium]
MSTNQEGQNDLSVLVIEDNLGDFILIEDYLIEKFNRVNITQCDDSKSAINYLSQSKEVIPSIILLDLHLPDMSGLELIENILSHSTKIPIIVLTGYSDLNLAKKSLQMGIYDFLIKDEINPALLHKSIEFAISREKYISRIEMQNEKLKKIAWTQSHIVRAPLARMLGIMNFLEDNKVRQNDIFFWLKHLRDSANEMDEVIKKIINQAQKLE